MQAAEISLDIISFTKTGMELSRRVREAMCGEIKVRLYTKCRYCKDAASSAVPIIDISVGEWAGLHMREENALLFIGACGIAVRAIAPFLADKLQDAPVLVMDEKGIYVIPILSGHAGGANRLAGILAEKIGAQAVITTATDLNQKFAVDVFARENGFLIEKKEGIAKISAKILAGKEVTVSVETGHGRGFFEKQGMRETVYPPEGFVDLVVTSKRGPFDADMALRPKEYILGFGCKKGKSADEIAQFITDRMKRSGIRMTEIFALASISQKKEEAGIVEWCKRERVRFLTYSAQELREIEGNFTKSAFVQKKMGVDNVCERAALKACGAGGELIVRKYAKQGMTIAVAKRKWSVWPDEE